MMLNKEKMLKVGYKIGPELNVLNVAEAAIVLGALFNQCLKGTTLHQREELRDLLLQGNLE
jgi:hypothetical protein